MIPAVPASCQYQTVYEPVELYVAPFTVKVTVTVYVPAARPLGAANVTMPLVKSVTGTATCCTAEPFIENTATIEVGATNGMPDGSAILTDPGVGAELEAGGVLVDAACSRAIHVRV